MVKEINQERIIMHMHVADDDITAAPCRNGRLAMANWK
jgi:hypothetical protein